jgi:hypothetical protein
LVASLDTQISKSQPEEETIAAPRVTSGLIVTSPRNRERKAIVIISKAKPMADGFVAIGDRQGVFGSVGQVDNC